jgi:release factor glutamine methyltransferase
MEIKRADIGELLQLMKNELREIYPEVEASAIIKTLMTRYLQMPTAGLVIDKDKKLTESQIFYFQRALKRLLRHEPLQYIMGEAYFFGHTFKVNTDVLIPRPETEELVDWIISDHSTDDEADILDIGTGSGCIAISLALALKRARVQAIDISLPALAVALENAASLKAKVDFKSVDILAEPDRSLPGKYDVIVSNPPYVTADDWQKMRKNVVMYEPRLALLVEDDPLLFYRSIISFAHKHLKAQGNLYFECNESNANEVLALMEKQGFSNVSCRKDMQGKERMLSGRASGLRP